jgi:Protein of unknown function (DUF3800)
MRDVRKDTAALIPGPVPIRCGLPCIWGRTFSGALRIMTVHFVYLDEFGHLGPFMARNAPQYNENPVFGLAGIILPQQAVRPFATKILQLKGYIFRDEIRRSGKTSSHWEKKGTEIFTAKQVAKYPHFRATGFRLLNYIRDSGGKVFYYGREKISGTTDVNSIGLYKTVLSHALHQIEAFCATENSNFILVVDEHSARKQLLVTSLQNMYDHENPVRRMLSPPFEVESYANQNIQAADWIAAILARLWAKRIRPAEYADHISFENYFWARLHQITTHSTVLPR